jgi:hypothetical protein
MKQYQRKKHLWIEKIETLAITFDGVLLKVTMVVF